MDFRLLHVDFPRFCALAVDVLVRPILFEMYNT